MKIGIHQPQYLPWIHYFMKIGECDAFVLLDSVDYQKNGLQNRNQIKGINGKTWLTIPVSSKLGEKIYDIKIVNSTNWKKKHIHTLDQFYKKSEFYNKYRNEIVNILNNDWVFLNDINTSFINKIMNWLNLKTPIYKSSQLNVNGTSTDLIIEICKKFNADQYISGLGAKNYLDEKKFINNQIELIYLKNKNITEYSQCFNKIGFMDDLSTLDILFNCGDNWKNFLN